MVREGRAITESRGIVEASGAEGIIVGADEAEELSDELSGVTGADEEDILKLLLVFQCFTVSLMNCMTCQRGHAGVGTDTAPEQLFGSFSR